MPTFSIPQWFLPIIESALGLGFYDVCKKHAVRGNSVMPVLFFATLTGSLTFVAGILLFGDFRSAISCSPRVWSLLLLKSLLVGASWTCVYYAMRDLPISLAAPIRASSPLWTFLGGLILFQEIPDFRQAFGMILIFGGYYFFSVLGRMEGFSFRRSRSIHLILLGTLLGAASALYDKYLLNTVRIPRDTVQLWFSIDLVFILGAAYLIRRFALKSVYRFEWRWTIPATGILLILADFLYFYAVSIPDIHISILSLVRRCNCVVAFGFGCWLFHDANVKRKAVALLFILLGVAVLGLMK